jgi:2-amino-4-hydroxy-6-hydroxymethyldihydropteridine diphosphokinase
MPDVFVGVGSNADPARALEAAAVELERRFGPIRCSSVFRSAAVGIPAADYLNLVVAMSTELPVDELGAALRAIEVRAGRTRADPAVCELDLDVLVYGERVDAARRLPRPELFSAPFVLAPLAELAPQLVHPVTGERCRAAWERAERATLEKVGPLR